MKFDKQTDRSGGNSQLCRVVYGDGKFLIFVMKNSANLQCPLKELFITFISFVCWRGRGKPECFFWRNNSFRLLDFQYDNNSQASCKSSDEFYRHPWKDLTCGSTTEWLRQLNGHVGFTFHWCTYVCTHTNPPRMQRVIHSVLTCRVVLHIREQAQIQQAALDHPALMRVESRQLVESTQGTSHIDDDVFVI